MTEKADSKELADAYETLKQHADKFARRAIWLFTVMAISLAALGTAIFISPSHQTLLAALGAVVGIVLSLISAYQNKRVADEAAKSLLVDLDLGSIDVKTAIQRYVIQEAQLAKSSKSSES